MDTWIGECVSTIRFLVSINGELHSFFAGSRRLRQRDPLSPYLFVLTMEVLSGLIRHMARNNIFKFHWHCERVEITHLCFVDDLL